jgi:hypothetical protein
MADRIRRAQLARLLPGVTVLLLAAILANRHIPAAVVGWFALYATLGITLPGVALYRLATRRRRNLAEDVAAGFLVGSAVQLIVYLAVAPLGLQRWAWLWFVPVLLAAGAVKGWRRVWWGRVTEPLSPDAGWLLAAASAVPLLVVFANGPARFAPPYRSPGNHVTDMAFHQALIASARHDFPLQASFVDGEPLDYHYFLHVLLASVSWATGIDPAHLLYTLYWIPLALAGSVLTAVLVRRIRPGDTWVGPLAVLIAGLGGTIQPFADVPVPPEMVSIATYLSPTQNLGGGLAVLLTVLAIDLLRGDVPRTTWAVCAVLAVAGSGSKATVLPIVLCGLGLVLLVRLVRDRRIDRTAAIGIVGGVVIAGTATAVMFGGESYGLEVRPFRLFARIALYRALEDSPTTAIDTRAQLLTAVVTCGAWLLATIGLVVLLWARELRRDVAVVMLAGCAIAGFAGMVLTAHPGGSELYFHRTALPMIGALAALGLAALADRIPGRGGLLVAGSLGAGLVAAVVARALVERKPDQPRLTDRAVADSLLLTLAVLGLAAAMVTVVWWLVRRRWPSPVATVAAVTVVGVCTAAGILPALQTVVADSGATAAMFAPRETGGPTGTASAAALWLKNNSATGDLVATNGHCTRRWRAGCDSRHFWLAALTERHILVEGWSYTGRTIQRAAETGTSYAIQPYWDQRRLRDNDAAFRTPSAATVGKLRDTYGVRWLFADATYSTVPPSLGRFATLRYSEPGVRIYELR